METFLSPKEQYKDILRFISDKTGIDIQQLECKRNYPAILYRQLVFGYLVSLGYTHQNISDFSGISRPNVSHGVKRANLSGDVIVSRNFKLIMKEYERRVN